MQTFKDVAPLRSFVQQRKHDGRRIAFVPTMGNLHEGHLALVRKTREHAPDVVVVVSIFVNPLQLSATDAATYPRTLPEDASQLETEHVDALFMPSVEAMYPRGMNFQTTVDVAYISTTAEGASRPGYFAGIATVVAKLFNIVTPDIAVFGEKDYQQLCVIRNMVLDMAIAVEIVSLPTVREEDGLALSSRNRRLTTEQRLLAPALYTTLSWVQDELLNVGWKNATSTEVDNDNHFKAIVEKGIGMLEVAGFHSCEIVIADAKSLRDLCSTSKSAVILGSAKTGETHLIDNIVVDQTA